MAGFYCNANQRGGSINASEQATGNVVCHDSKLVAHSTEEMQSQVDRFAKAAAQFG